MIEVIYGREKVTLKTYRVTFEAVMDVEAEDEQDAADMVLQSVCGDDGQITVVELPEGVD